VLPVGVAGGAAQRGDRAVDVGDGGGGLGVVLVGVRGQDLHALREGAAQGLALLVQGGGEAGVVLGALLAQGGGGVGDALFELGAGLGSEERRVGEVCGEGRAPCDQVVGEACVVLGARIAQGA